ncbi:cadherin repeat domain-containing protein, partial [bacterium c-19]|nr:cadherin repeat domain-containing protein [bacterium c-19]
MSMRKKLLITVFISISVISSVYGYHRFKLNAAGSYTVAAQSTGRIGLLKQGDRIYMGTKYNGTNLEMQLLKSNPNGGGNNVWLTMSKHFENAVIPYTYNESEWTNYTHNYSKSLLKNYYATLNGNIVPGSKDEAMIIERSPYSTIEQNSNVTALDYMQPYMAENRFWCLTNPETQYNVDGMSYQLINSQEVFLLKYDRDYWAGNGSSTKPNWISFIGATGVAAGQSVLTKQLALRASAKLNLGDVVFALSIGTGSNYTASITNPVANTTNIWNTAGDPMKIRLLNPDAMNVDFSSIKNDNNDSIQKAMKGTRVKIYYDNATVGGNNTISLLLSDTSGSELKYYEPLEPADNSGIISFDTGNIPIGKYQAYLVNEEYTTDAAPVYSSPLSNAIPFEITEHKISYTKQLQSGATVGDYEFSKNVNAGQAVGKVTVNPQGVMPLTYTVEANGDNSYLNFEIDGLDSNNASSSTPLNVKIKSGAPDLVNGGLKAGTYKFCVSAKDANGYPATATSDTKVCTSFTVEKTALSIAFNDPSQTKKSISAAATSWNETATANPNTGTKITYSVSGGDVSLISIDPDTGAITYTGSNAFGKVKIKATVDDDPTTGNDNYNSAFVEKEIVIYREVDGSVTPDANSSDTTTPTFTASDSNIRTGGIIGTIHGTLGTPDTIGGSTTTYHYGLKPGGDASFFSVDANTGVIKTTANLGVNSYHITVTVSDNWSTKEIPVTINVGVAAAEDLKFYENSTSTTA